MFFKLLTLFFKTLSTWSNNTFLYPLLPLVLFTLCLQFDPHSISQENQSISVYCFPTRQCIFFHWPFIFVFSSYSFHPYSFLALIFLVLPLITSPFLLHISTFYVPSAVLNAYIRKWTAAVLIRIRDFCFSLESLIDLIEKYKNSFTFSIFLSFTLCIIWNCLFLFLRYIDFQIHNPCCTIERRSANCLGFLPTT